MKHISRYFFWVFYMITVASGTQVYAQFPLQQLAEHEFYFVRHGQTDHNIGKVTATTDVPLNAQGQIQARQAAQFIATLPIKTICYSPLRRTRQTKDAIVQLQHVPAYGINGLREGPVSCWHELQKVKNHDVEVSNTLSRFLHRLWRGLNKALQHPAPVLIVAHGGVYSALCRILDVKTDVWAVANCTVVRFYQGPDGRWLVQHLFDVGTGSMYDIPYIQDQKIVHV